MPRGITSKLYVNDGSYDVPDWIELNLIKDLTTPKEWAKADASARRELVDVFEPTGMALNTNFQMRKNINDAGYLFLRAAHNLQTAIDVLDLDGDREVNGSDGVRYMAKLFKFDENKDRANVVFIDGDFAPCLWEGVQKPQIVTIVTGLLAMTPIGG